MEGDTKLHDQATASVGKRLVTLAIAGDQVLMGMNYRQWLIGQALAGLSVNANIGAEQCAKWAIHAADAVIEQVDTEDASDTRTADMFETDHQCCGGCKE